MSKIQFFNYNLQPSVSFKSSGHVNFFAELEAGEDVGNGNTGNKDREAEKKKEQEDYEKKIGLLTYLGQDTNELTGEKSWWQKLPEDRKRKRKADDNSDNASEENSSEEITDVENGPEDNDHETLQDDGNNLENDSEETEDEVSDKSFFFVS